MNRRRDNSPQRPQNEGEEAASRKPSNTTKASSQGKAKKKQKERGVQLFSYCCQKKYKGVYIDQSKNRTVMAKRVRLDEAENEKKQTSSSEPAKAITKYQKELEVFVRTKLGQNVVFGMKNCDKHLRVSYHDEDVNQKENRKIIDLFQDLLPFPVIIHGWKGGINVWLYRPEDIFIRTEWEFDEPWGRGNPKNDKWFYTYYTSGFGTVEVIIELIRISQELFYLSRFGGKFTTYALMAYEGLQDKENTISQQVQE